MFKRKVDCTEVECLKCFINEDIPGMKQRYYNVMCFFRDEKKDNCRNCREFGNCPIYTQVFWLR